MGVCSVSNFIDGFYRSVYCCIKPYSKITACNIFINSAWYTNAWNVKFMTKFLCSFKTSITANHHNSINTSFL